MDDPIIGRQAAISLLGRLSSGTKMLFIMTMALMPLGLIALFASIQSAHTKKFQHEAEARLIATAEARQIDLIVTRSANVVRYAGASVAGSGAEQCRALLGEVRGVLKVEARLAYFAHDGTLRCATRGFAARRLPPPRGNIGTELLLLEPPGGIRFTIGAVDGSYGVGEIPLAALRTAVGANDPSEGIALHQGAARLQLTVPSRARALDRRITVSAPIAGGQINLVATSTANTISAIEILLVLLPLLMWAAAAVIGWVVVNELLLRPLAALQRSVSHFGTAATPFALPRLQTPAREIRGLGEALSAAAEQIAHREAALEEGLRRQVLLTREVHHRVKNNLQVVASLINLHARGTSGDVAGAYASIQRRVDALAVVHRNHFAELEEHRGVALRTLIVELASNLRATAPAAASSFTITLDMIPVNVSQDVAVPVAFLVTEIVELLMRLAPRGKVAIELVGGETPDRALLSLASAALTQPAIQDDPFRARFDRIVLGLARQLRGALAFDAAAGRYAILIPIVPADPARDAEADDD